MTVLSIPYPPTANNLFINTGKGRAKSSEYKAWIKVAGQLVMIQRPAPVRGAYVMTLTADRPDNRVRDVANLEKPVSDLLVSLGVIEADHLAQRIILEWSDRPPARPASVRVVVEAYAPIPNLAVAA